jgi:signal transduction histidine kinase
MNEPAKKILLIEDNPGDSFLFQDQLRGAPDSFDVVVCRSLIEGLKHSAGERFHVVFLDLSLPESAGLETVRKARAVFHDLPIIVLTGLEDEQLGLESLRAGAQDYMIKGKTSAETISRAARYAIERQRILSDLQEARNHLEEKIQLRTAELDATVKSLQVEIQQRRQAEYQVNIRAGQLRALAGELTLTEQRERRRLAQLLHDHLQQLLVAVNLRVSMLGMTADEHVKQATSEIGKLLDESISATRFLTAELSPSVLHDLGLAAGLEWLARWMAEKHGIHVNLTAVKDIPAPAEDVKVLLFESVRELLFNAVKHANVSSVTVNLGQVEGNALRITVSDAGTGFDPASLKLAGQIGGGFGLFSIRERLDLIGGNLEIDSSPGKGSRFILTAPSVRESADRKDKRR